MAISNKSHHHQQQHASHKRPLEKDNREDEDERLPTYSKSNKIQTSPNEYPWVISKCQSLSLDNDDNNNNNTDDSEKDQVMEKKKETSQQQHIIRWASSIHAESIQHHHRSKEYIVVARDVLYSSPSNFYKSSSKIFAAMPYKKFFEMWTKVPRESQHYYECLLNQKPCRFFIDIDAPVEECTKSIPSLDYFLRHVIAEVIIPEAIELLHQIILHGKGGGGGGDSNGDGMKNSILKRRLKAKTDFTLLVACKKLKKYSAHIICHHPLIYFENMKVVNQLNQEIARRCARKDESVIKTGPTGERSSIIDSSLQGGSLRLFGSSKLDDPSRILSECSLTTFLPANGYDIETLKGTMLGYHPPEFQNNYIIISKKERIYNNISSRGIPIITNVAATTNIGKANKNDDNDDDDNDYCKDIFVTPFHVGNPFGGQQGIRPPLTDQERITVEPICCEIMREYYREFEVDLSRTSSLRFLMFRWIGMEKKALEFRIDGHTVPCLFNILAARESKLVSPHQKVKCVHATVEGGFRYVRMLQCYGAKCNRNWQLEENRVWRFTINPIITIPRWKLMSEFTEVFARLAHPSV